MKVLVITNMFPSTVRPYYGIFVKEYVDSMRKLGVQMDVFFSDTRTKRTAFISDLASLRRTTARGSYDLVHAQHSYSVLQLMLSAPFGYRRMPLLFTFHEAETSVDHRVHDPDADAIRRLVYSKRIKRAALTRATSVVSVCRGFPEAAGFHGKYSVIPPGVDLDRFQPRGKRTCRQKLGLALERPLVLFPADPKRRFHKGTDLFEEALPLIPVDVDVRYGGTIAPTAMPDFMNAADVIVQTSRFEASPMVVKEAMACNRPVVSTNVGDVEWLFGETKGCFLTEATPSDVAAKISAALGFSGPTEGRARIKDLELGLDQVARRYNELYRRVLTAEGRIPTWPSTVGPAS